MEIFRNEIRLKPRYFWFHDLINYFAKLQLFYIAEVYRDFLWFLKFNLNTKRRFNHKTNTFYRYLHLTWKPPHVFIVLTATRSIFVISARPHKWYQTIEHHNNTKQRQFRARICGHLPSFSSRFHLGFVSCFVRSPHGQTSCNTRTSTSWMTRTMST